MFEALVDLSTVAGVACDERPTRWASRYILNGVLGKPVLVEDRELVHRLIPVFGRTAPVGRDVAQGQPDQLAGGSRRTLYSMRHTYATEELLAGTDIHTLSKQMGTSARMLEAHYSKLTATMAAKKLV